MNDETRDFGESGGPATPPAAPWWSQPSESSAPGSPADEVPVDETPVDETRTHGASVDETPAYETPAYGPPAAPVDEIASGPERRAGGRRTFGALRSTAAVTVAAVVVSAAAAGTVVHLVDNGSHSSSGTTASSSTAVSSLPQAASLSSSVKSALAKILPSVVIITDTVTTSSNGRGGFGGFGGFEEDGAGTGIIITSDGEIVTNAHVVNGATDIKVALPNNGGTHAATIVGINTTDDLAVIKISGVSNLTAATFANSDSASVGDSVIAVGNAEGYGGSPTVTEGIISAKDRSLQDSEDNLSGLLQTDAAINPGNSGGPLVDANGDVVGINVAVATGTQDEPAQNIGFTIPSNTVVKDLPALKAGENSSGSSSGSGSGSTQTTAYLGVEVADSPSGGAVIEAVESGSPASTAGLQAGEVITAVNGTQVSDGSDLQQAIQSKKPGASVTLSVTQTSGATSTVKVTLGSTQTQSEQQSLEG